MKRLINLLSVAGMLLFTLGISFAHIPEKEFLYVGTYTAKGEGIYVYTFNRQTKTFSPLQVLTNKNSPSFLEFHPNKKYLYSANEGNATVTAYSIDQTTGKIVELNSASAEGSGPCHVSVDPRGRFLYVSNYGSGSLAVYHLQKDGQIGKLADSIQHKGDGQQKPRMHSIIPSADGRFIYASDLGIDKIMVYAVHQTTGKLSPASNPFAQLQQGDGPRHFAIHPNGNFGYSAGELNNVVNSFRIDKQTGALTHQERVSMLPDDFKEKSYSADIHFSADGKFLYASNRGHESLVIYEVNPKTGLLKTVGHVPTEGKHPRNFMIDERSEFALVANKDNDNVVFFNLNPNTGLLKHNEYMLEIPTPVCVKLLSLP